MDVQVWVAIIAVAGPLALAALNAALGKRAQRAQVEVAGASAQVETALRAMGGMEQLATDRLAEIDRLRARDVELEADLADERAASTAIAKMKGVTPNAG